MKKIVFWLRNARIVALPQSLLPSIVAFCMAVNYDSHSVLLGILAIFGVIAAHLSVNLFDDYFDFVNTNKTSREEIAEETSFVRVAKSPYLYSGEVSPKKLFFVASAFAAFALLLGCIIFFYRGITPLIIALIAGFLGFFYSAAPLKLCYHGLGEIVTGLIFGPLLMGGVFYSATGSFTPEMWVISAVVGLLVINILFTHSIMDFNPDKMVGKKTLAGVLKSKKLNLTASFIFNFTPYIIIAISIIMDIISPLNWIIFAILPLSIYLFHLLYQFCYNPDRQFSRKWWLGPMENWNVIEEHKMEWFAIRWYLSRNILQFFCLLFVIFAFL